MPAGRPTEYQGEKTLAKVREYFEKYEPSREGKDGRLYPNPPPSNYRVAKHLGISAWTVWNWEKIHPEFSKVLKEEMEALYPEVLQENAILGLYNASFSIFSAKNRLGWQDTQNHTHRMTVEPILIRSEEGATLISLGSTKTAFNGALNGSHAP